MSKQLVFVIGAPNSGRTTWINKNLPSSSNSVLVDASTYPDLYVKSEKKETLKLFEDTIEDARKWCLEQVGTLMELETPPETIVLSLIGCRPDRWREFVELASSNEYELKFKFPTNKLLYYTTKHNTTMEQYKYIESKSIHKYPRDKKEVKKKSAKGESETIMMETNESTLLRQVVLEAESAYSFYLTNRTLFGDKNKLLEKINEQYKAAIKGDIKRAEKKTRDAEREAEKKAKEAEREAKKQEKIKKEQEEQESKVEQEVSV
jgi:hypothetical protein